jgi:hypothetical protein
MENKYVNKKSEGWKARKTGGMERKKVEEKK